MPAAPARREDGVPGPGLVERLRAVHLQMVEAVLSGDGLERVARIAADAAGTPVAIVIPRLDAAAMASGPSPLPDETTLEAVRAYAADRVDGRPSPVLEEIAIEVPIASGDEEVGIVVALAGAHPPSPDAVEHLHLAAVASLTEVAIEEAKEEVELNLRGSFLEDLRCRPELEAREIVRRARRLGCDLSGGGVALCAGLTAARPRHVVALIAGEYPGALAQHMDDRVYAVLPAAGDDGAPEATLLGARRLAERLRQHGTVGLSGFYAEPGALSRAIKEAELVLDVLCRSETGGQGVLGEIHTGSYRLLFRVLASHPEEVRSFYEDTVAPIVRHDEQYRTDLVGTVESYLEQNCNMNATAAAIYAHRHTVAYRLERVKELTRLDPMLSEDRERLGLGLKAYRMIAPRLPR